MDSTSNPDANDSPLLIVLDLTAIRDIIACADLITNVRIQADIHGIVTNIAKTKHAIYITIHDATGALQLKAASGILSSDAFEQCKTIKKYMRVHAVGSYERVIDRQGSLLPTILLSEAPATIEVDIDKLQSSLLEDEMGEIGSQIFLARFRDRAAEYLTEEGFLALETRSISIRWQEEGVRPLRLDYPGFGNPAFLVPSPRTQLLRAMVFTGRDRLFSIARCFTPTHRDSIVSAESLFVAIECLNMPVEIIMGIVQNTLRYILNDVGTSPNDRYFLDQQWEVKQHVWPPPISLKEVTSPEVQVFDASSDDTMPGLKSVFRVCWPPDIVLAEGASEVLRDAVSVSTASIHLERLISTIVPARRRIEDLRQLPWRRQ